MICRHPASLLLTRSTTAPQRHCSVPSSALQPHEAAALRSFQQQQLVSPTQHPICLGRVKEVYSGCRGLLAAQQLVPGQLVLLSSPQNTLAVPLGKNLHRWEHEWLEPFEQAHATLPSALVDVLMEPLDKIDPDVKGTWQLTLLLLYARRLAAAATAAGKRSLWADWQRLLPQLAQATAPFGPWSDDELELLLWEPYKGAMADSNQAALQQCQALLAYAQQQLPGLQLAGSLFAVVDALYLVKTRSVRQEDCLCLVPMLDFINHSDTPNCVVTQAPGTGWTAVVATSAVAPGTELTFNYLARSCSNLDLLLAWGFLGPPTALDPVLPLAFRALAALDVKLVAAAAADVLAACSGSAQERRDLQSRLLAAAASLPLATAPGPGSVWRTAAGAGSAAAAAGNGSWMLIDSQYADGAGRFVQFGMSSLSPWAFSSSSSQQQAQQTAATAVPVPGAQQHKHPGQYSDAAPSAGAAAAAADMFGLFVSGSSRQQQDRVAQLQEALCVASACGQHSLAAAAQAAYDQGPALHVQLQCLSAQACAAALQLQLLQPALAGCIGRQQQGSAAAATHWQQAQELQHQVVAALLLLQAGNMLGQAGSLPPGKAAAAAAAAQDVVNAVQHSPYVLQSHMSLKWPACLAQQLGLQELLDLQREQTAHLLACEQARVDTAGAKRELSSRAAVAAEVNRSQEKLLQACGLLLGCITESLQAACLPHGQRSRLSMWLV